jgi:predicted oxidoreductase
MTVACEKYGIKLASNQIEFNLARTLPLKNGLLDYMRENDIVCLACESEHEGRGLAFISTDREAGHVQTLHLLWDV